MDIAFIRAFCLQLPAVTEEIKWGADLVFSVGGKMFCVAATEPPFQCCFKVPDEEFEILSVQPGFRPAPYLARARWVAVTEPGRLSRSGWETYIRGSYELVVARLTRKARGELGIG
ncbi:MAG TPA: MmcQ/YjbR family DNA-binding protein [Chitinophagaceae bacterium]|jgi:predicted DNA-binding protein (MmcQ/YjbR family)|nr:MmcQ/YjbR family DNA-binding protein [Chitinophagaceae bacterium]